MRNKSIDEFINKNKEDGLINNNIHIEYDKNNIDLKRFNTINNSKKFKK